MIIFNRVLFLKFKLSMPPRYWIVPRFKLFANRIRSCWQLNFLFSTDFYCSKNRFCLFSFFVCETEVALHWNGRIVQLTLHWQFYESFVSLSYASPSLITDSSVAATKNGNKFAENSEETLNTLSKNNILYFEKNLSFL